MSEKVKRAEELRKYIESKNMSRSGLERVMSVLLAHIESLHPDKGGEEKAYEVVYVAATSPLEFIDAMEKACKENGEMDYVN